MQGRPTRAEQPRLRGSKAWHTATVAEPAATPRPDRAQAWARTLLDAPLANVEARAPSRWAYPPLGLALVTLFIAYHLSILLMWLLPGESLAKPFRLAFLDRSHAVAYFEATRNTQGWAMFAPDPTRANAFIRVLVTDQNGDIWDLGHDLWGKSRWPYVFYDRSGKVNRRLDAKKGYQRIYGAWVCREWARQHGGEAPKSVQFVRRWTWVPSPSKVLDNGGWDPWQAPYQQFSQETITCATVVDGLLSNELRARYGFEPVDDSAHRSVEIETWWTEREGDERDDTT